MRNYSLCKYRKLTMNIFFKFFKNVYLFLRERERERACASGGGAEREGDRTQSRFQPLSCQHRDQRRARTHEP